MTKELSALFDGELEMHEGPDLWATMKTNSRLQETWRQYKLIGDAMRDEGNLSRDITAKVMRELSDEPIAFAPRPQRPAKWSSTLMALAASVAGISVVGWLAAQQFVGNEPATLARVERPKETAIAKPGVASTQGMQEYMLAHQANAPGLYLQGGAQHIRTVSVVGGSQ
jgi:negative regulator of sigma E activity